MNVLSLEDAQRIEDELYSDLSLVDSFDAAPIFTFKDLELRTNPDNYAERLKLVGDCFHYACEKQRIPQSKLSYYYKEELQNNNFHIHCLLDVDYLTKRRIPAHWFYNHMNNFYSSPITSYKRTLQRSHARSKGCTYLKSSWKQLEGNVTEPRVGWMKILKRQKEGYDSLVSYQSKLIKGNTVISNGHYVCSKGLVKKLNWLSNIKEKELCILQRN